MFNWFKKKQPEPQPKAQPAPQPAPKPQPQTFGVPLKKLHQIFTNFGSEPDVASLHENVLTIYLNGRPQSTITVLPQSDATGQQQAKILVRSPFKGASQIMDAQKPAATFGMLATFNRMQTLGCLIFDEELKEYCTETAVPWFKKDNQWETVQMPVLLDAASFNPISLALVPPEEEPSTSRLTWNKTRFQQLLFAIESYIFQAGEPDDEGFGFEVPLRKDAIPSFELIKQGNLDPSKLSTAMVTGQLITHPVIGRGLLILTKFPCNLSSEEVDREADHLNKKMISEGSLIPQLGAFCKGENDELCFIEFFPDIGAVANLSAGSVGLWTVVRIHWAAKFLGF